MNKANTGQVVQTANVNWVNIRNQEVSYFLIFFSNFATQAALIATCIIQSVSQLPALDNLYTDDEVYTYYNASGSVVIDPSLQAYNTSGVCIIIQQCYLHIIT